MDKIDLTFEIDLHFFSPKDTEFILNEFINFNISRKISRVRIIHGKGKSVKKHTIQKLLSGDKRVISFSDDSSNWGCTIADLDINPDN
jgi:DNA-nicking Smr family endonuclease